MTTGTTGIQRVTRKHYKRLHADTLGKLEEMGKFLETHNHPKLKDKVTENLSRLITTNEM